MIWDDLVLERPATDQELVTTFAVEFAVDPREVVILDVGVVPPADGWVVWLARRLRAGGQFRLQVGLTARMSNATEPANAVEPANATEPADRTETETDGDLAIDVVLAIARGLATDLLLARGGGADPHVVTRVTAEGNVDLVALDVERYDRLDRLDVVDVRRSG